MSPGDHEGLIPYDFGRRADKTWRLSAFDAWRDLPGVLHAVTSKQCPLFSPDADTDWNAQLYADLARSLKLDGVAYCTQVHGPDVLVASRPGPAGQADAIITNVPGLGVLARAADCPLILLADAGGAAVGVAHASWRSTQQSIVAATVRKMAQEFTVQPSALYAIICPSAGPCCYEVGREVRDQAIARLGADAAGFFRESGGKIYFNLWAANRDQLVRQTVSPDNIYISGICTICRNDMFPSYRVEGRQAGRFACVVARRDELKFKENR